MTRFSYSKFGTFGQASFRRDGTAAGLGGSSPSGHAAQHVHSGVVQRSEVIAEKDNITRGLFQVLF